MTPSSTAASPKKVTETQLSFLRTDPNDSLFLLQSLNGIFAITTLFIASIFRERESLQHELLEHKINLEGLIEKRTVELTDANEKLKTSEKVHEISEDDSHRFQDNIQELTNETIKKIDELLEKKEAEILEV